MFGSVLNPNEETREVSGEPVLLVMV